MATYFHGPIVSAASAACDAKHIGEGEWRIFRGNFFAWHSAKPPPSHLVMYVACYYWMYYVTSQGCTQRLPVEIFTFEFRLRHFFSIIRTFWDIIWCGAHWPNLNIAVIYANGAERNQERYESAPPNRPEHGCSICLAGSFFFLFVDTSALSQPSIPRPSIYRQSYAVCQSTGWCVYFLYERIRVSMGLGMCRPGTAFQLWTKTHEQNRNGMPKCAVCVVD